jgi:hypothetical protein
LIDLMDNARTILITFLLVAMLPGSKKSLAELVKLFASWVASGLISAGWIGYLSGLLKKLDHTINDMERQDMKAQMARDFLKNCPNPQAVAKCNQAQKDLDDATAKYQKDLADLDLIEKQLKLIPVG